MSTNVMSWLFIVGTITLGLLLAVIVVISDSHFRVACEAKGGTAIDTDKYGMTCISGKEIKL